METNWKGLDLAQALDLVGGDLDLLREVASLFLEESPRMMSEIVDAFRRRDPSALAGAAHGLKGCVATFGAQSAVEAALALETAGRNRDLSNAAADLIHLERAMEALTPELLGVIGMWVLPSRDRQGAVVG